MSHVLILGGGLGGLVTGALLSQQGHRITLLEKNTIIGGGLQCFERHGTLFPTGMHVFGGFQTDGMMRELCSRLGIMEKLHIRPTDSFAIDEIHDLSTNRHFLMPQGRENYTEYLCSQFPHQDNAIRQYIDGLYRLRSNELSQTKEFMSLYDSATPAGSHDDFLDPYDEVLGRYISDEQLRWLLQYISPLYAGIPGHTPAYIHAMVLTSHIDGSFQFEGGSQQLADALADVIRQHGGSVIPNEAITNIIVENRQVTKVQSSSNKEYTADCYVSAMPVSALLDIVSPKAFTPSFTARISSAADTYSAFKLFVQFKPEQIPFIGHPIYIDSSATRSTIPHAIMAIMPPSVNQGPWAQSLVLFSPMDFDEVKQWEQTTVGHRGNDYSAWKQQKMATLINTVSHVIPNFSSAIENCYASSPLTIRDYYGNRRGSLYGLAKDGQRMAESQLSVRTKVRNLFLTGQNINLHGMFGVTITAQETAHAVNAFFSQQSTL